jgi:hypothetical protein
MDFNVNGLYPTGTGIYLSIIVMATNGIFDWSVQTLQEKNFSQITGIPEYF